MHRHSEEDVAAVVLAAVTELRRRQGAPSQRVTRAMRESVAERVRSARVGVLPREWYENAREKDDPPYSALPPSQHDEDRLLWMITQAMTGD